MVIKEYKSASGKTKHYHTIDSENPDVKSYASLLLLQNDLLQQDVDFLIELEKKEKYHYLKRIEFSQTFLRKKFAECGELRCSYCNKTGLIIEENGTRIPDRIKATVDHIVPVSKGGGILDENNVVVACSKCNRLKDNLELEAFLVKFKNKLSFNFEVLKPFLNPDFLLNFLLNVVVEKIDVLENKLKNRI